jgi:hypothetical protein
MIGDVEVYDSTIEGYVFGENAAPLDGVTTFIISIAQNKQISNAYVAPDNYYTAFTEGDPAGFAVVFKKSGYQTLTIPFLQLMNNPDVTMKKGNDVIVESWMIPIVLGVAFALIRKKSKKGKVGKIDRSDVFTIFIVVGGMIAFNLIRKILEMFGLGGDGKIKDQQADPGSPWKPDYYKQFDSYTYAITQQDAEAGSYLIYNAFSVFQDDFNQIMSVFSKMRTKANVSYLADIFQRVYHEDLLSFLGNGGGILPWDGLSTSHLNTIIDMVSRLPTH